MSFEAWRWFLLVEAVFFGLLGIVWAVMGTFDPTGTWDAWMATGVLGHPDLSEETRAVQRLLVGLVGALNTGYFVLFGVLVAIPIRRREVWAWNAIVASGVIWACIDMSASVACGAAFNAYLVDVAYLTAVAVPLVGLRRELGSEIRQPASP